jgi:uncharacterized protein YndB with AHSA1/START domain
MSDFIEKQIELNAPVSRVWQALTDYRQFGTWFRVDLDGPFVAGKVTRGRNTTCGYENFLMEFTVRKIEPQTFFAYTWHPYAIQPDVDYSGETPTLVEFRLAPHAGGTLLSVRESGFDAIPEHRRAEAFRMHESGWAAQLANIEKHVTGHSEATLGA